MQVSRNNGLKIPKEYDIIEKNFENSEEDLVIYNKIPYNSNDLIVITKLKKLCLYVITITEKSPKKFRGVFVNRMQNYCLDAIELLLQANFVKMNSQNNKLKREKYQQDSLIKLKLLSYVSLLATNSGCILKKQYKQVSIQLTEVINLLLAWKKSDDERWNKKIGF